MGEFSLKSILMSVLIFVLPELSELCEPSWLPGI